MSSNIKSISSTSHPIGFEFGDSPKEATVTFSADKIPNKDFVLNVKVSDLSQPSARIQENIDGKQAIMASFFPNLEVKEDEIVYSEIVPLFALEFRLF